jgi:hypothetical protein
MQSAASPAAPILKAHTLECHDSGTRLHFKLVRPERGDVKAGVSLA